MDDEALLSNGTSKRDVIALCVRRARVKDVKTQLECYSVLDRSTKITLSTTVSDGRGECYLVPTLYTSDVPDDLIEELGLTKDDVVRLERSTPGPDSRSAPALSNAVRTWYSVLPVGLRDLIALDVLLENAPTSYSIYLPMLLLSSGSFEHPSWTTAFGNAPGRKHGLFSLIAKEFSITHIAINAPVPSHSKHDEDNILRSPININPAFGDFGPKSASDPPTREDFHAAFWVSTKQNGIVQTWAPLHTMFSRGNVKEKARLLQLPSVVETVKIGRESRMGCTAIDLYAGIGYFAFSYAKAGFGRVLCWELNPWSVEGLRRGAGLNKWDVEVRRPGERVVSDPMQRQIVVFQEDNLGACRFVLQNRESLGPVRHVNCGLLPTSRGSWRTAVMIIDPVLGGWIHIHENIPVVELQERPYAITDKIQRLAVARCSEYGGVVPEVTLDHVEKVKTYAPGIMHCVLDIRLSPADRGYH